MKNTERRHNQEAKGFFAKFIAKRSCDVVDRLLWTDWAVKYRVRNRNNAIGRNNGIGPRTISTS